MSYSRGLSQADRQLSAMMASHAHASLVSGNCRPGDPNCYTNTRMQQLADQTGQRVDFRECPVHGQGNSFLAGCHGHLNGHSHHISQQNHHQMHSQSAVRQSHVAAEIGNTYTIGTLNVNLGGGQQMVTGSGRGDGRSATDKHVRMGPDGMQVNRSYSNHQSGHYSSRRLQAGGPGMPSAAPPGYMMSDGRSGGMGGGPSGIGGGYGGGRGGRSRSRGPSSMGGPSDAGASYGGSYAAGSGGSHARGHSRGYARGYAYEYSSGKGGKMSDFEGKLEGGEGKLRGLMSKLGRSGALTGKGGRPNLRGSEYGGGRSGSRMRETDPSLFGDASRASGMPARSGPGLLRSGRSDVGGSTRHGADYGWDASRAAPSRARSSFGGRMSKAGSDYAGKLSRARSELLTKISRANSKAGSMVGSDTRSGRSMNEFGSRARSRYNSGKSRAGSMFSGFGKSRAIKGPPSRVPDPPSHMSGARAPSGAGPRAFGESCYEPSRGRSRSHSRAPSAYGSSSIKPTPVRSPSRGRSSARVSGFTAPSRGPSTVRGPSTIRAPSRGRSHSRGLSGFTASSTGASRTHSRAPSRGTSPSTKSILSNFSRGGSGRSRGISRADSGSRHSSGNYSLFKDGYSTPSSYRSRSRGGEPEMESRGRSRMSGRPSGPPLSNALQRSNRSAWNRVSERFSRPGSRAPNGRAPSNGPRYREPSYREPSRGREPSYREPSRGREPSFCEPSRTPSCASRASRAGCRGRSQRMPENGSNRGGNGPQGRSRYSMAPIQRDARGNTFRDV